MPQRMSMAAENRVMPQPGYSLVPIANVSPNKENPLNSSQNPRTKGSANADTAGEKDRIMPIMSSIIPPIMSHPLPLSFLWKPIPIYIIPDRAITMPKSIDKVR